MTIGCAEQLRKRRVFNSQRILTSGKEEVTMQLLALERVGKVFFGCVQDVSDYTFFVTTVTGVHIVGKYPRRSYMNTQRFAHIMGKWDELLLLEKPIPVKRLNFQELQELYDRHVAMRILALQKIDHAFFVYVEHGDSYKHFAVTADKGVHTISKYPHRDYADAHQLANLMSDWDAAVFLEKPILVRRLDFGELQEIYQKQFEQQT